MTTKSTNRVISLSTLAALILTGISTSGVVVLVAFLALLVRPNITYSQASYQPEQSVLCPGDQLAYTPTIHVARLPAMPTFARSWWSVDQKRTVIPAGDLDTSVWTKDTPREITSRVEREVPDLPPGRYELRVGVRAATIATYSVPFTVPEGCGA